MNIFTQIIGLPGLWVKSATQKYTYTETPARSKCPVCGSCGWVWAGFFTCDGDTQPAPAHIALVGSGVVYIAYKGLNP